MDKGSWNVCYLFLHGIDFSSNRQFFPTITRLIESIPGGHYHHALLSAMAPNTHILPHHGPTNRKLRCQLPIVVPGGVDVDSGSYLRVGSEKVALEEGRMIIFDDSFEHEAWNDASSPRIVLIFDIWHPDFSNEEVRVNLVLPCLT